MNFQEIKTSDPISEAPLVLNQNFDLASDRFEAISSVVDHDQKTLRLTTKLTPVAGTGEMAALVLTSITGIVLSAIDTNGSAKATLSSAGDLTLRRVVASGTGANATTVVDFSASGAVNLSKKVTIGGILDLTGPTSTTVTKLSQVTVVDANCGSAATTKVNLGNASQVLLDYNNAGSALAGQGQLSLDVSTLVEGEIIILFCSRVNAAGGAQGIYNGTTGQEIFAYLNPTGAGVVSLPASSRPAFAPGASPNTLSFLKVRWTNIGGGAYRLLVLEAQNVANVG